MVDDLFQSEEPAVVHVGRGQRHVAKRRRTELSGIQGVACHTCEAWVGHEDRVEPVVVHQVVGELHACFTVAMEAVPAELAARHDFGIAPFAQENLVAVVLLLG